MNDRPELPPIPDLPMNTTIEEGLPWWVGLLVVGSALAVVAYGLWAGWR
jgi:hypothetical protein